MTPVSLYAIGAGREFVKFGYASSPQRRLCELQSGCPLDLQLLSSLAVSDQRTAMELEQLLHRVAARYHVRGEWFLLSAKTLTIVRWLKLPPERFETLIREASLEIDCELSDRTPGPMRRGDFDRKS